MLNTTKINKIQITNQADWEWAVTHLTKKEFADLIA